MAKKTGGDRVILNVLHPIKSFEVYSCSDASQVEVRWEVIDINSSQIVAVYDLNYRAKDKSLRRWRFTGPQNKAVIHLPDCGRSLNLKQVCSAISIDGHYEQVGPAARKDERTIMGRFYNFFSSMTSHIQQNQYVDSDHCVKAFNEVYEAIPSSSEKHVALWKMLNQVTTKLQHFVGQDSQHSRQLTEKDRQIEDLQNELGRERDQKIQEAKMSGGIQDASKRDQLELSVQHYFSQTVNQFVNAFRKNEAVSVQVQISKNFCDSYAAAVDRLGTKIEQFLAGAITTLPKNVTLGLSRIEQFGVFKVFQAWHSGGLYTTGFHESDWETFMAVMVLKSHFLREHPEIMDQMFVEVSKDFERKCNEIDPSLGKLAVETARVIVEMLTAPNPVIPYNEFPTFRSDLTELTTRQSTKLMCSDDDWTEDKVNGSPIKTYVLPILLTAVHGNVGILRRGLVMVDCIP